MSLARPPFPDVIDNSMRSTFRRCPRRFELEYLHHWRPDVSSIHLHAGIAFAHGIESVRRAYYVKGLSAEDALIEGWVDLVKEYGAYVTTSSDIKTVERMCSALVYYFSVFQLDSDFIEPLPLATGERVFEFSFSIPIDVNHPVSGSPIIFYGRFDMLGQHKNGEVYVTDEKTASQLGRSWIEGWSLDAQFTGYCYAARSFGHQVAGALIRGISVLKNGHGHAQSIQARSKWEVDRWYDQFCRDVRSMIRMWEDGHFDYDLSGGCKMYGGCHFRTPCKSPDPQRWLEADFVQRQYSPWLRNSQEVV